MAVQNLPSYMNIDFSDVKTAEDFTRLPAGKYLACVTKAQFKKTEGNPSQGKRPLTYLELEFEVTSGQYVGSTMRDRLFLEAETPEKAKTALSRVKKLYESIGFPLNAQFNLVPAELLAKTYMINVEQRYYTDDNNHKKIASNITYGGYYPAKDYDPSYDAMLKSLPDPEQAEVTTGTNGGFNY